ncbi:hypothetical protein K488DRAFT_11388, partial [Vararia minispora EC-137]
MTEFWVSKKQYWCKYCETFIRDDAPSRRQHENGLRHQGNKERFVRNLYKQSEKAKKDADEEKREMARIEQAAQAAFSSDVASGRAKQHAASSPAGPSSSSSGPTKAAAVLPSTRSFTDYSTAESLGYIDPDAERAQAEFAKRQTMGFVGDWQPVQSKLPPPPQANEADVKEEGVKTEEGALLAEAGKKRPAEADGEEDERGWKLRRKTASVGLGEIYDPGVIAVKPRIKK